MTRAARIGMVVAISALAAVAMLFVPPVAQDQAYHLFADQRTLWGIPRACDVLSNAPFLLVGWLGLVWIARHSFPERRQYAVCFAGIALTCFGSAWYHWAPDDARLVWDRLPMTLAFMGFFSALVADRISRSAGHALLGPLLVVGLGSVVYWRAAGDLRVYILVQFLPLLLIPTLLALFAPGYTRGADVLWVIAWYLAAKALEWFDAAIFAALGWVSGHTLKHLAAAGACWMILRMVRRGYITCEPESPGTSSAPDARAA
jgi:hypothetical protein